MKQTYIFLLLFHLATCCNANDAVLAKIDSLHRLLRPDKRDTVYVATLSQLSEVWQFRDLAKAEQCLQLAYTTAQELRLTDQKYGIMFQLSYLYSLESKTSESIEMLQNLLLVLPKNTDGEQLALAFLSLAYKGFHDVDNALLYARRSFWLNESLQKQGKTYDRHGILGNPMNLAQIFEQNNQLDSALWYAQLAYRYLQIMPAPDGEREFQWEIPLTYGKIERRLQRPEHALMLYREGHAQATEQGYAIGIQALEMALANYFQQQNQTDSVLKYAQRAFAGAVKQSNYPIVSEAGFLLKNIYAQKNQPKRALYFFNLANIAKDSLQSIEKMRQVQALTLKEVRRENDLGIARMEYQMRLRQYAFIGGLLFLCGIAWTLYRNNAQKQRINEQLTVQKQAIETLNSNLETTVETRTAELQHALHEVQTAFEAGQTNERARVSADLHDEIGSALSTIAIFSDLTKMKAQQSAPELVQALTHIGNKSRDMIQTMRDTIWTLKGDDAQSIWERMFVLTEEMLATRSIALQWQLPDQMTLPEMPFNTKRQLFLAYKEAIHNVIKHAEARTVWVKYGQQNQQITLQIRDDGKGFDATQMKRKGNGLQHFSKRMLEIGGTAHVQSTPSQGTRITFSWTLPTANT